MPEPLPISTVNHVSRATADVEKSRRFYRDVLGFREVQRPPFRFDGAWLYNDHVMIHLIDGDPPPRSDELSGKSDHVAFHSDEVERVERLLDEHGLRFLKNVNAAGLTQLFFNDPDGNTIEIAQYPAIIELKD